MSHEADDQSTIDPNQEVGLLAISEPRRTRVFAHLGIEFCCGAGNVALRDAVAGRGLDLDEVVRLLDAELVPVEAERDWSDVPLDQLIDHIVDQHHNFVRTNIEHLAMLVQKVARRHGEGDPRLVETEVVFLRLAERLMDHIESEERILFPAISALDAAVVPSTRLHDGMAEDLRAIRVLLDDYRIPEHVCPTHRALLDGLGRADRNIRQHFMEEQSILYPRFVEAVRGTHGDDSVQIPTT